MDEETKVWIGEWLNAINAQQVAQTEYLNDIRSFISVFYWISIIGIILGVISGIFVFLVTIFP